MKNIGILAFTQKGEDLASKLAASLNKQAQAEIFDHSLPAKEYLKENFRKKDTFIFVCATGIAVRMIAPLIKSKDVDPAVVVMDELGRYAIPLLSGHLGGANEAAAEIAEITGAEVVVTTATDINGKFAVDVWSKFAGCKIANVGSIKAVSSAILRGEKPGLRSSFVIEGKLPEELTLDDAEVGICVSLNEKMQPYKETLHAVPKIVTLGVGCRKNANPEQFEKFILSTLEENNVSIHAIEKIASIELKKYEKCILAFSEKYNIPFVTYSAEELLAVPGDFNSSDFVKSITGVDNICERSAVLGSDGGRKILSKTSQSGCTAAMAMKDWKCKF